MSSLETLADLFDRPVVEPIEKLSLHKSLAESVGLPDDYLRFLATFGPGTFDNAGLPVLAVADLTSPSDETALELFATLYDGEYQDGEVTLSGFRAIPGVIPWAHDFEETKFYWIARTANPQDWSVGITSIGRRLSVFSGTMVDLLLACIRGSVPDRGEGPLRDVRNMGFTKH